jgi:hypothetical protein
MFSKNEDPVIVKFIDGTYGVRKKEGGKYLFMDNTDGSWWSESNRHKYCRFETLEAAKNMNDVGIVIEVGENGKGGDDVFRCSQGGKGGN